jgi:hypothetical protein
MDKKFNATGEGQKQMFYTAGKVALRKSLSDFINKRNNERFAMVEKWRADGQKEEDWKRIELFDEDTEKQVEILESI